jgi:mRNA interferase MazF
MRAGDIVIIDFGTPQGSEPGFVRPAVVVTADAVLEFHPRTIHVVPITSNVDRRLPTEVELDDSVLPKRSVAQAHLAAVVSIARLIDPGVASSSVGPVTLAQIRDVIGDLLDIS